MPIIAPSASQSSPAGSSSNKEPGSRSTLLVVDDEDGPLQALQILFRNDYNVLLAGGGKQALDAVQAHSVDAVILDIRMPDMSGIEVLKRLKEIDSSIEVIMLTAYETLETARQALRLGARDYLTKPFEIETIRQAVATAMDYKNISQKIQYHETELKLLHEEIQNQSLRERIARTRGEIYGSILHDINGPLTVIAAFVDMLNHTVSDSTRIEGEPLETIKDRLYRVAIQVDNCISISRRYLSFLRQSPGSRTFVSVNQALNDVRQLLKARPDSRIKDLRTHFLETDVSVGVNGTDLVQILLNLAVNAFQSSQAHSPVEIQGRFRIQPLIRSEFEDTPGQRFINWEKFQNAPPILELSIRDSGQGIPPDVIDRIFDPFFSTKPTGQGTGLGLSIVKRLVDQSNGCIHIRSVQGEGTEFQVYLPAQEVLHGTEDATRGQSP